MTRPTIRRPPAPWLAALFLFACGPSEHTSSPEPTSPVEAPEAKIVEQRVAKIQSEEVSYEVDGVKLSGYLAWDADLEGPRPGVLVVHEWWGHNDYVRMRANMLAELGYTAFALDMYGEGKLAEHPDDARTFVQEVMANAGVARKRFVAAHELLSQHPTVQGDPAAIGYCFGGSIVVMMAREGVPLAGVAAFHPGGVLGETPAEAGSIKGAIRIFAGGDDPMLPPEARSAFEDEMNAAGVDAKVVVYPGARHGFTVASNEKAYDQAADTESWNQLVDFLAATLGN